MRGVSNEKKRRAIFDKHRFNADFLILQETHSTPNIESVWENEWGGGALYSHGSSAARGVAIFCKKEWKSRTTNIYRDLDGRVLIIDVAYNGYTITLAAIYAPNEDTPTFFTTLAQVLRDRSEHKIIIGDFNLTMNVELDRENTYCNNNRSLYEVQNICDEFYMLELWRIRNEEKREFSWMKKGTFPLRASRIDFALVSAGLDQKVEMIQYLSSIFTDHRAVYVVVDLDPFQRRIGYWKFNAQLLQQKDFVEVMNREIDLCLECSKEKSPVDTWENLKVRIKKTAKKYANKTAGQNKLIISQLSEVINAYEERLPLEKEEYDLLEKSRSELEEKTLERIQGVMFRSKVKWFEEGERNTKYFYSLEKTRYNAKTCYKMINRMGIEIESPEEILEEQRLFYEELYQKDPAVQFTWKNLDGPEVPVNIRQQQECQISLKELGEAAFSMKNGKTPGEDGIPIEFYKVFWSRIKDPLMAMAITVFERGYLHSSGRKDVLNLIPKGDKDTRYVKNLRPITLLNTDYKIIEKAIAFKMLPALEHIISKDQRGFMKERRISVNIRKLLDIIHQVEKEDLEAVILSLDFVKCFDKCSFSVLFGSLEYFKFGTIVQEWTHILYKDFSVVIQNNGYFSKSIPINQGVHQGGCCSSLYFLVIAEILALSLRANEDIEGIKLGNIRNLLNQFADDMDIASLCTEKSLQNIYNELEAFRLQSGFTVSYEKTTLYRIGSLRHSDAQLYGMSQFAWSNLDINVLGVTIAHESLVEKNYEGIIEKVKKVLLDWKNRNISLLAKIQVVNTLVASLFVYKMMVLPLIPKAIIRNVNNIIREYIWNQKKAKIAFNILQLPKKEGGTGLVDLEKKDKALKATWPQLLYREEEYSTLVYSIMRCSIIGENIWRCNLAPEDVPKMKVQNQFWKDVLGSWAEYNYYTDCRVENQIIWFNSKIRVGGKVILWGDVCRKGLMYVYQLFHQGKFKGIQQLRDEYGLTTLRANGLIAAIPGEWRDFFIQNDRATFTPIPPHNYDMAIHVIKKKLSGRIYKFLSGDTIEIHNKYIKWRVELNQEFAGGLIGFRDQHVNIYKLTNVTKLRSFQYRLLQRGLVTNIQLEKWGMKPSELCSFCHKYPETLSHLFWYCSEVQMLWGETLRYIQERFGISSNNLEINVESILINRLHQKGAHVVNFICLMVKQFIYSQRCLGNSISFAALKTKILQMENVEKYIATKNQRTVVHQKKWMMNYTDGQIEDIQNFVLEYCNEL